MCTISESKERKTADRDLPCVKILQIMEDINGNPVYVTPYMYMHVSDEALTNGVPLTPNDKCEYIYRNGVKTFLVENGFIHAYSGVPDRDILNYSLEFLCKDIGNNDNYLQKCVNERTLEQLPDIKRDAKVLGIAVFLAVVPEGTEYIEGEDSKYYDTRNDEPRVPVYAAKQLRLIRPVKVINDNSHCRYNCISEEEYEEIFSNLNTEISGK